MVLRVIWNYELILLRVTLHSDYIPINLLRLRINIFILRLIQIYLQFLLLWTHCVLQFQISFWILSKMRRSQIWKIFFNTRGKRFNTILLPNTLRTIGNKIIKLDWFFAWWNRLNLIKINKLSIINLISMIKCRVCILLTTTIHFLFLNINSIHFPINLVCLSHLYCLKWTIRIISLAFQDRLQPQILLGWSLFNYFTRLARNQLGWAYSLFRISVRVHCILWLPGCWRFQWLLIWGFQVVDWIIILPVWWECFHYFISLVLFRCLFHLFLLVCLAVFVSRCSLDT